jgi:hypothetical protein
MQDLKARLVRAFACPSPSMCVGVHGGIRCAQRNRLLDGTPSRVPAVVPQALAACCSAASSNERVDEDAGKRRRFAACAGNFRRFDEAVHGGSS